MDKRDLAPQLKWWERVDFDKRRVLKRDGDWIPVYFEVCGLCDGTGKHVNPSIDAHGISPEEFYEDPDFAESYFSGRYDVPCNLCGGNRVVPIPSNEDDKREVREEVECSRQMALEVEAERRMGA